MQELGYTQRVVHVKSRSVLPMEKSLWRRQAVPSPTRGVGQNVQGKGPSRFTERSAAPLRPECLTPAPSVFCSHCYAPPPPREGLRWWGAPPTPPTPPPAKHVRPRLFNRFVPATHCLPTAVLTSANRPCIRSLHVLWAHFTFSAPPLPPKKRTLPEKLRQQIIGLAQGRFTAEGAPPMPLSLRQWHPNKSTSQ